MGGMADELRSLRTKNELMKVGKREREEEKERSELVVVVMEDMNEACQKRL